MPNMLMVGGNSRYAGKTTLACAVIATLGSRIETLGLKVTSIRPGEDFLHGDHASDTAGNFVWEETSLTGSKDTSRMLLAGAKKVFYLRYDDGSDCRWLLEWLKNIPSDTPVVCESRNLRNVVVPGLYILVNREPAYGRPKAMSEFIPLADSIVLNAGDQELHNLAETISFSGGRFRLDNIV